MQSQMLYEKHKCDTINSIRSGCRYAKDLPNLSNGGQDIVVNILNDGAITYK